MWGRRLGYLASVLGCLVLYLYFNQWAAWVILWWLLLLPILSLGLSFPGMKSAAFTVSCPEKVTMGAAAQVQMQVRCRFPVPLYKCKFRVSHCLTGQEFTCRSGEKLQTQHCGAQRICVEYLRLYDYLGLFCRNVKNVEGILFTVEPVAVPVAAVAEVGESSDRLVPKRGGGFSEEHDLRHYVPGDDLRQIHWKLTAKTGKVVVREPMEQQIGRKLLTLVLSGSPDVIDRKLGRLLWLSSALLERNETHQVAVLTGNGLNRFSVSDRDTLTAMLQKILASPLASVDRAMPEVEEGMHTVAIGGEADGE